MGCFHVFLFTMLFSVRLTLCIMFSCLRGAWRETRDREEAGMGRGREEGDGEEVAKLPIAGGVSSAGSHRGWRFHAELTAALSGTVPNPRTDVRGAYKEDNSGHEQRFVNCC